MFHRILTAMLCLSFATPVLADTRCERPYAPEIPASKALTNQQMQNTRDDVQTFIAASDIYQACVMKSVSRDFSAKRDAPKLIDANQREKQRVGGLYNALVRTYKQSSAQTPSDIALVSR